MGSKISKENFYNFNRVLSYNAVYNFIVGGRGTGKTYGAKKLSINAGIRRGEEFVYVRRFKEELDESRRTFFDAVTTEFPKHEFRMQGKATQVAKRLPDGFEDLPKKEQKRIMSEREWRTIGYFIALTTAQRFKSTDFPNVKNIIFDEFIIEKGLTHYLPSEKRVFDNLYNTIDRYHDRTRVFFLANSVSIDNPYFIDLEIDPDNAVNGIIIQNNGFTCVHFPDSEDFKNEVFQTRFGRFIAETSPEYADYAVGNVFQDNHKLLLEGKDYAADYLFTVETSKGSFSIWNKMHTGVYYAQKKRPRGNERMFTLIPNKMSEDKTFLEPSAKVLQGLRAAWRTGNMRFDSAQTRNAMLDIFKR